jgi:hypothetical protein
MATTTVRVDTRTRDRLNELARRRRIPAGQLIDELVRQADDRALLDAAAAGWASLAGDPSALARYRAEADELSEFDAPLPDE